MQVSTGPRFLVCLNQPGTTTLNGAYTLAENDFPGINTSLAQRMTLPIPFYLDTANNAALLYRGCSSFSLERSLDIQNAAEVGNSPNGLSQVATELGRSHILRYLNAMYRPLACIWIVVGGSRPGIYPNEQWARDALTASNKDERLGFVVRGGQGGFLEAVKVYTSNGRVNKKLNTVDTLSPSETATFYRVTGDIPSNCEQFELLSDEINITPVSKHIAPIRGAEVQAQAETLAYIWECDGATYPATPSPSPPDSPAAASASVMSDPVAASAAVASPSLHATSPPPDTTSTKRAASAAVASPSLHATSPPPDTTSTKRAASPMQCPACKKAKQHHEAASNVVRGGQGPPDHP